MKLFFFFFRVVMIIWYNIAFALIIQTTIFKATIYYTVLWVSNVYHLMTPRESKKSNKINSLILRKTRSTRERIPDSRCGVSGSVREYNRVTRNVSMMCHVNGNSRIRTSAVRIREIPEPDTYLTRCVSVQRYALIFPYSLRIRVRIREFLYHGTQLFTQC